MASAGGSTKAKPKLRTVIVDDSALARLMLRDALSGIAGIRVVGNAAEGGAALDVIHAAKPGLIILDVEMPGMSGIDLLKEMNSRGLDTPVLMCSRLTREGAEVTTEALLQGAYDFVSKPSGQSREENIDCLRRDISQRIAPLIPAEAESADGQLPEAAPRTLDPNAPSPKSLDDLEIDVILIGSSTGGPAALRTLLSGLRADIPIPVLIVQHIPAGFSEPLARRLDQCCPLRVVEAADDTEIVGGTVYVAPGGRHLSITRAGGGPRVKLVDSDLVNGCRPSVDVLLEAARNHFGGRCLVVTLTGMGRDGADGALAIRSCGGIVFAQRPESCIVSSMPRQTIQTAGADRIADLPKLSELINRVALRRRSSDS